MTLKLGVSSSILLQEDWQAGTLRYTSSITVKTIFTDSTVLSTPNNSWPPPEFSTVLWLVENRSRGMIAAFWLDDTATYTFLRGSATVWCTAVVSTSGSRLTAGMILLHGSLYTFTLEIGGSLFWEFRESLRQSQSIVTENIFCGDLDYTSVFRVYADILIRWMLN
jgi:hypothetical protein